MSKPPTSAQRAADFRETAREIHARSGNPVQSIAAALEKAYKRGWAEREEGAPPEPDTTKALPWNQIPPRPRQAFDSLLRAVSGYGPTPRPFTAADAEEVMVLLHVDPASVYGPIQRGWQVFRKAAGDTTWQFDRDLGDTTVNPLIRAGLLEIGDTLDPGRWDHSAWITNYGIESWLIKERSIDRRDNKVAARELAKQLELKELGRRR